MANKFSRNLGVWTYPAGEHAYVAILQNPQVAHSSTMRRPQNFPSPASGNGKSMFSGIFFEEVRDVCGKVGAFAREGTTAVWGEGLVVVHEVGAVSFVCVLAACV